MKRKDRTDTEAFNKMPVVCTDETKLTFGIHKGKQLIEVPDSYLLWLYNNGAYGGLLEYLEDNLEAIKNNSDNEKRRRL